MKRFSLRKSRASGSTKRLVEFIVRNGRHPSRRRHHSKRGDA